MSCAGTITVPLSVFVFEATFVFSLNAMYLVFGYEYQRYIQIIDPTTCLRWHLSYGKAIFSCFCMLDHMLNFLDLQKELKNYQSILFSSSSHSFQFTFIYHSIYPNRNNSNSTITITIAQPTRTTIATSLSSHSFVIDFSITTEKEEQEQPQNRNPNPASFRHQSCNFQLVSLINWLVRSYANLDMFIHFYKLLVFFPLYEIITYCFQISILCMHVTWVIDVLTNEMLKLIRAKGILLVIL